MELYLNWLNENERGNDENEPIGIILCAKARRAEIELLKLDKSGIAVAEFWTKLPPKEQFEKRINEMLADARERMERRKMLGELRAILRTGSGIPAVDTAGYRHCAPSGQSIP